MTDTVVLLNADFTPLGVIGWRKAMKLITKGKVEIVAYTDKIIHAGEKLREYFLPKIIRLVKFIRTIFKTKVPYNKRNVLLRDNFTCAYCGKRSLTKMSIDHVTPRAKGGKSTFDNTVTCCIPCNFKKDDRTCREANMFPKHARPYEPTVMEFILLQIKRHGVDSILREHGLL